MIFRSFWLLGKRCLIGFDNFCLVFRFVKRNMVTFPEQKWRLVHHLQQWTLTAPRPPRIMEPQFSHQICSNLWLDQTNLTWDLSLSAMTMMIMMQLLDWFSFCRDFLSTGKNMMPIDHREPSPYRFVIKLCDRFFVQGRFLGERLIWSMTKDFQNSTPCHGQAEQKAPFQTPPHRLVIL